MQTNRAIVAGWVSDWYEVVYGITSQPPEVASPKRLLLHEEQRDYLFDNDCPSSAQPAPTRAPPPPA
jgi:hypothetical protein